MLHAFVNCATVLTKRLPQLLLKAEQRPLRTCQLRRGRVFEAWIVKLAIVNCGMKKKIQFKCAFLNFHHRHLNCLPNRQVKNKEARFF
jgi:hypothetical protein